jgi:uncharacterized OB-fold protein
MRADWHDLVVPDAFDNDILPFWNGLKSHQFLLYTCSKCGRQFWPMTLCPDHDDIRFSDMQWRSSSGAGSIFSWVVAHRFNNPVYAPDGPFALILVELNEGPIFPTRLSTLPKDLRIGMRVKVAYVDVASTGMTLPLFELDPSFMTPASGAAGL